MDLRPYQEDAVTSLFDWFGSQSITDHPLLSLPTASGKTVIFSTFIKRQIMSYPDTRFLVLAHRQELIEQAENKIKNVILFSQARSGSTFVTNYLSNYL